MKKGIILILALILLVSCSPEQPDYKQQVEDVLREHDNSVVLKAQQETANVTAKLQEVQRTNSELTAQLFNSQQETATLRTQLANAPTPAELENLRQAVNAYSLQYDYKNQELNKLQGTYAALWKANQELGKDYELLKAYPPVPKRFESVTQAQEWLDDNPPSRIFVVNKLGIIDFNNYQTSSANDCDDYADMLEEMALADGKRITQVPVNMDGFIWQVRVMPSNTENHIAGWTRIVDTWYYIESSPDYENQWKLIKIREVD